MLGAWLAGGSARRRASKGKCILTQSTGTFRSGGQCMERDFWTLIGKERAEPRAAEAKAELPYFEMSRVRAYESVLPVFSSVEKVLSFARHVAERHSGKAPTPIRLTQKEIQEWLFRGDPYGRCVVDPAPNLLGRETMVGELHAG